MDPVTIPSTSKRLLVTLLTALLGHDDFAPGRPAGQRAVAGLGESLCRWLDNNPWLVLTGGNPAEPTASLVAGLTDEIFDPSVTLDKSAQEDFKAHLAGFWQDRRLALICFRQGLTSAEFDHLYHLLSQYSGKGLKLRNRLFEEQSRGNLPNVSLVSFEDLPPTGHSLSWQVKIALAWLKRDLNVLSRCRTLPTSSLVDWREQVLSTSLQLPHLSGKLAEFFAHLDLIAETIDNYDKDELVFSLLEELDESLFGELCLQLCKLLEPLQPKGEDSCPPEVRMRRDAITWVARRLAEQMQEQGLAGPEHLHALVLNKVLLYEEIPPKMRPRVASLQVLTSFLADPQKYFAEVESSHSPEVLETRMWRILEMLPKLVEALRFDVARQVLEFSRRFGPSFDLKNNPDIMAKLTDAVADALTEAPRDKQAALMQALPQMGRAGVHLLIELADHRNRSVRRTAFDALLKIGQPVVPILFETLESKKGWHYLRNMLLLLAQLNAGGPKVENLFRRSLNHPEANIRKEALPGISRLLGRDVAALVIKALDDKDPDVKKRAAACIGLTGVAGQQGYTHLANILSSKDCGEDLAMQIVVSINRLKPDPEQGSSLEPTFLAMLGITGFLGFGGRKGSSSKTLKVAVIQALGFVGGSRAQKGLAKLTVDQDAAIKAAAAESIKRITSR